MMKMTMKCVFVSPHYMTLDQKMDLESYLGCEIKVFEENVTFSATDDVAADLVANLAILGRLFDEYDVVTGVFPPVAIEALMAARNKMIANPALGLVEDTAVLTPVSRQHAAESADGSKTTFSEHVRFARI